MADFITEHFINPILSNGWFNPVNTAVYSLILIGAVYLVYNMLRKMKIHIDRYFLVAIMPFIFWGSSTRVLHDAAYTGALATPELNAFFELPIFPTPGSYIITFSLALVTLLCSLLAQRYAKVSYWKPMAAFGTALCVVNIVIMPVASLLPLLLIVPATLLFTGLLFIPQAANWGIPKGILTGQNNIIVAGHLLDASATTFALFVFGYVEQHVLPRALFPILGFETMFLLKIAVVLPVLWLIDRYTEDRDFRNFLKIVVFILGVAPGLRDLLRLIAGV
jgi:uncharacterized membrane protein